MKKTMKKIMGGFLAVGLVLSSFAGMSSYASTPEIGAVGALADTTHTLEEMLTYAIQDEYLAQAEYDAIMKAFNVTKPYSNIIKSEATHISLLTPLFTTYKVALPSKDWSSLVTVPATLEEANKVAVETEVKNIAMYEQFLKQELPEDVKAVFERLKAASEKHLKAFQRQVDGVTGVGNGFGKGEGARTGKSGNGIGGNGQGNRSTNQTNRTAGDCLRP